MTAGRPRKEIDQETFEKLCGIQCTLIEICGFFNCSEDTIRRYCRRTYQENFESVFKSKSATGKISLRRSMFRQAENNATMAIWLSKQHLGMTDKIESTPIDNKIEIVFTDNED